MFFVSGIVAAFITALVLPVTVFGTIDGTIATLLLGALMPGVVLLSLLGTVLYAFVNTMAIWGIGFAAGRLRGNLPFMPKR